jgi:hypothetical protein
MTVECREWTDVGSCKTIDCKQEVFEYTVDAFTLPRTDWSSSAQIGFDGQGPRCSYCCSGQIYSSPLKPLEVTCVTYFDSLSLYNYIYIIIYTYLFELTDWNCTNPVPWEVLVAHIDCGEPSYEMGELRSAEIRGRSFQDIKGRITHWLWDTALRNRRSQNQRGEVAEVEITETVASHNLTIHIFVCILLLNYYR